MISRLLAVKKIETERIQESIWMEKDMEKESLFGITDRFSKENGRVERRMALGSGSHPKVTTMKGNGSKTDRMEKDIFFT